jgi:hypothetical protein
MTILQMNTTGSYIISMNMTILQMNLVLRIKFSFIYVNVFLYLGYFIKINKKNLEIIN